MMIKGVAGVPGVAGVTPRTDYQPGDSVDPRSGVYHDGKYWFAKRATADIPSAESPDWQPMFDLTPNVEAFEGAEVARVAAEAAAQAAAEDRGVVETGASQVAEDRQAVEAAKDVVATDKDEVAQFAGEVDAKTQVAISAAAAAEESQVSAAQSLTGASSSATVATQQADRAELAADAAIATGVLYETQAAGEAATAVDALFRVVSPNTDDAIDIRKRTSGGSTFVRSLPSAARVGDLEQLISEQEDGESRLVGLDARRRVGYAIGQKRLLAAGLHVLQAEDGAVSISTRAGVGLIDVSPAGAPTYAGLPIASLPDIPGVEVMLLDGRGRGKALTIAGSGGGGGDNGFGTAEIAAANTSAAQITAAVRATLTSNLVVPTWGLTLYLIAGQSLSVAFEAWPVRDGPIRDVLMMGTSIHPHVASGATWAPMGNVGGLNPFVRTVRGSGSGTLLDAAGQAALVAPAANPGVTPLDGAMDQFRAAWLRRFALPADPSRKFVVAEAGVGGTAVGEWLPGASPELFNRLRTAILAAQTEATNLGVTFGVGGLIWVQGENDYIEATTRADYVARATTVFNALRSFVATITGQTGVLPIWMAQTGGTYTKDAQALAIANAQIDLCKSLPGVFMAGSVTPVFDKGGHLAPNGSEWLGNQIGRVMDITQLRGEGWEPCRAIRWTRKGREALCEAHTPVAPLQFLQGWVGSALADPANHGIVLKDSLGTVPIASVEIVAPQVIRVIAARDFGADVTAWLGTEANTGAISIADSDPSPLVGTYVYAAGSGQAADQNIASRVGLPYQTANWMVASVLPVTPS